MVLVEMQLILIFCMHEISFFKDAIEVSFVCATMCVFFVRVGAYVSELFVIVNSLYT